MPKEDINREIHLHIPKLEIVKLLVDNYSFWGYNKTRLMLTSRQEMQGDKDVNLVHGEIIGFKRKWWQLRSHTYRLAYITAYTWMDKVAKTEILAEIRVRALGLPTHFETLKSHLEKYVGQGRVNISFWDDEPYEVR